MLKRKKTGGRQKGSRNRVQNAVRDSIVKSGDVQEMQGILRQMARGDLPCNVCRGKGKTAFEGPQRKGIRACQSCGGDGFERINPRDRGWAASELLQYVVPKLKSIDHITSDGSMRPTWVIEEAHSPQVNESPDPDTPQV